MRILAQYSRRKARIEIIPLIDIIFFLLATFVMVSLSMIKNEGVSVHLPTASTGTPMERRDSVTISVTKNNEIYFEKTAITLEELKYQLTLLKSKTPDVHIFINGDEAAPFKSMMQVLDSVRSVGISKVAMQTQPSPKTVNP